MEVMPKVVGKRSFNWFSISKFMSFKSLHAKLMNLLFNDWPSKLVSFLLF